MLPPKERHMRYSQRREVMKFNCHGRRNPIGRVP